MKIQIVQNKYVNTLLLLMLLSAAVHMVILMGYSLVSGNGYILNYFNILDLELFYPSGFNTLMGNIGAGIAIIAIYLFILHLNKS